MDANLGGSVPNDGSGVNAFVGNDLGVLDGVVDNDVFSRQESEQELCQECLKYSYIPSGGVNPLEDINVIWI